MASSLFSLLFGQRLVCLVPGTHFHCTIATAQRGYSIVIFLDGAPNMHTLEALHIGQTVKEAVERDLHAELDARSVYQAAASHCHSVRDYVTRDLFETLMHDEEEHVDFFGDSTRSDW